MSEGPPIEVIGAGPEPDDGRRPRAPLPRSVRALGYVTVGVVAVSAIWLAARPHPTVAAQRTNAVATSVPATRTVYPSPDVTALLPVHHDLSVSPMPGQRSFIAFSGHILLFLQLEYSGPSPVRVVDGRVPQDGAYPDAGAGGLTAGTTANVAMRPGVTTEVFVRTRVDCDHVLLDDPVDHLDLITQASGQPPRAQILDLTLLGAYWDEARHAACARPDAAKALTVGVDLSTVVGSPVQAGAKPWVDAELSLHNAAGFEAVALLTGTAPPGLTLVAPALTSAGADVDGGATYLTPLRWVVRDCAAAQAAPPPGLSFAVTVADSHGDTSWTDDAAFGSAWRLALSEACG
jgi:hypothetical protein